MKSTPYMHRYLCPVNRYKHTCIQTKHGGTMRYIEFLQQFLSITRYHSTRCVSRYTLPTLFKELMRNMREIILGLRKAKLLTSSAAAALQNVPQIPHSRGVGAQMFAVPAFGGMEALPGNPSQGPQGHPQKYAFSFLIVYFLNSKFADTTNE